MSKQLTPEQKEAKAIYAKEWYAKNKEKRIAKHKEWLANNKEKVAETQKKWLKNRTPEQLEKARARGKRWDDKNRERINSEFKERYSSKKRREIHLKSKFGLTQECWDAMFEMQGKVCAICKTADPCSSKGWHTDHCHNTGKVRGILCAHCNHVLGRAFDNPATLRNAADYLIST